MRVRIGIVIGIMIWIGVIILYILFIISKGEYYKNKEEIHEWFVSGSAPLLYPTAIFYSDLVFPNGRKRQITTPTSIGLRWGYPASVSEIYSVFFPAPDSINIIWFSFVENQFYSLSSALPKERINGLLGEISQKTKEPQYNYLIAGMAPFGRIAIWLRGKAIGTEVAWLQAEPIDISIQDLSPRLKYTQDEYRDLILGSNGRKDAYENLLKNGLPDRILFEHYMQRFNYRIIPQFEDEDAAYECIHIDYYNGEYMAPSISKEHQDYRNARSGEHEFAMRGMPHKIILSWRIGETEYSGYFWTNEATIIDLFNASYGNIPSQERDLLIEIGRSNNKFRISLQKDTHKTEIAAGDIQIYVSKDYHEYYRSPNLGKP